MKDISILLVEESLNLRREIAAFLSESGARVEAVASIRDARQKLLRGEPRLLLLDVDHQDDDVLSFLSELDSLQIETLVLTDDTSERQRIEFFERRVMDIMPKPIKMYEIGLRLRRFLRPRRMVVAEPQVELTCGKATLDIRSRTLRNIRKKPVSLTASEFRLLYLLIQNEMRVVDRLEIVREVLGHSHGNMSRSIDVMISKLRRKLDEIGSERFIRSVRSEGYMLISEDRADTRQESASRDMTRVKSLVSTT